MPIRLSVDFSAETIQRGCEILYTESIKNKQKNTKNSIEELYLATASLKNEGYSHNICGTITAIINRLC